MSKSTKVLSALGLTIALSLTVVQGADATNDGKVMWGKTELKLGQIGKVTILKDTNLVKLNNDGSISTVRKLTKGDEFRVYQYKGQHGGLYGVGSSSFVQKNDAAVLYETPSKKKLELVNLDKQNTLPVTTNTLNGKLAKSLSNNTLSYIRDSNFTVVSDSDSVLNLDLNPNKNSATVLINKENNKVELVVNPVKDDQFIKDSSKLLSYVLKDLGYSIPESMVKIYINKYFTGEVRDIKITGDLHVKSDEKGIIFYSK